MPARPVVLLACSIAASLAVAPLAASVCTEVGCVRTLDEDADGAPDGVVAATATELTTGNAYASRDGAYVFGDALVGDHDAEQFFVLSAEAGAWLEGHDGSRGLHAAWLGVHLVEVDGHSGSWASVAEAFAEAHDHDGDGVPEDVRSTPALP